MADFFGELENQQQMGDMPSEAVGDIADALKLDLDDKKFAKTVDTLIDLSKQYFDKKDLKERRAKNLEYYLGKEIASMEKQNQYKKHHARYLDNVIYEAEQTLKPIALSRIPDLMVNAGNNNEESKAAAETLTDTINSDLRKRENRNVLGRAYKHRPIYFVGIIKHRWDPTKGKHGDYRFESIHPENIDVDHTANSNDTEKMKWIAHHYPLSLKEVLMKFPRKKKELLNELGFTDTDINDEKKMLTPIRITEIWFTWYDKKKDENGEEKWEKIEGVAWKYKDVILEKMKNPNWDWEGEAQLFTFDEATGTKKEVTEEDFRNSLIGESIQFQEQKIFRNHVSNPQKPFIFLGYDQLGMMPYDETSRIEQVLYLQDNINKRGKQITEMADRARAKNVFSTDSGLKKEDIERIDMSDPDQDLLIDGDLRATHTTIQGDQPIAPLFQDQDNQRERVFAKMGAHATTRGEREADETATGRQILREADFGKQDDEVEETINYAAEQMANAAMQYIKLRYTEDHLKRLQGADGVFAFQKISRDLVEDGMEIEVAASGVDKARRRSDAFQMAQMQMTDPLTFFEDMGVIDPKGRTERLLLFLAPEGANRYMNKYILGNEDTAQGMATALNGQTPKAGRTGGRQEAVMAIAAISQGGQARPPTQLTGEYIQTLNNFIKSGQFNSLPPNVQEQLVNFATGILNRVEQPNAI